MIRLECSRLAASSMTALTALVLLMTRRRLFVPVMITLLAINMLLGIGALVWLQLSGPVPIDPIVSGVAIGIQCVIGGLWIAYLLFSQRVREVCVN